MSEKNVQQNEEVIKGQIKELVRGSVEEPLNELLATFQCPYNIHTENKRCKFPPQHLCARYRASFTLETHCSNLKCTNLFLRFRAFFQREIRRNPLLPNCAVLP